MTSVREMSLKAHRELENERAEQQRLDSERRAAEEAEKIAEAYKSIVLRSPLARWFPDVEWVVIDCNSTGDSVVVHAAGEPTPLFAIMGSGQSAAGDPIFRVSIVKPRPNGAGPSRPWVHMGPVHGPADIGAYLAYAERAEVMAAGDE